MLAIVDYKAGNQTSVRRALEHLGIACDITADSTVLRKASGVVFPGVGAAGQAMQTLAASGLDKVLAELVQERVPLLGICLGCQILLERSEENDTPTLGLLPGVCRRFAEDLRQEDGSPAPVPHMGWNSIERKQPCRLLEGVDPGAEFYFVHSYYVQTSPDLVVATSRYGHEFCAMLGREGLWATQFHPEKSGRPGLTILENFHKYCLEVRPC